MKILLVDDDRELLDLLSYSLRRAALTPVTAYDAPAAFERFGTENPSLLVLDLNLGTWDGLAVLREIRRTSHVPIIILSSRDLEEDKVKALEMGADDYLTKPFSHRELIARIRVQLRKLGSDWPLPRPSAIVLRVGPFELAVSDHSVRRNGTLISLTGTEFRLLQYLMNNAGVVVPLTSILRHVWGHGDPSQRDVVRVTLHRLRRKLETDPANPEYLMTVAGVGVMLKGTLQTPSPSAPVSGESV